MVVSANRGGAVSLERDLLALSKGLKATAAGQAALKNLLKELRTSAKSDVVDETRKVARVTLPRKGGLNVLVAKTPQRITARAGNTTATVSITIKGRSKGSGASQSDTGRVRHPVFNQTVAATKIGGKERRLFVSQRVRPGWFTNTAENAQAKVALAAENSLDKTAKDAGF